MKSSAEKAANTVYKDETADLIAFQKGEITAKEYKERHEKRQVEKKKGVISSAERYARERGLFGAKLIEKPNKKKIEPQEKKLFGGDEE